MTAEPLQPVINPERLKTLAGMLPERRDCLEVFAERDFKGASQKLPAGKDASYDIGDLMVNNGVGNDTISSLKMPNDGGP
ncbi:MAG: hypothetical protein ACRDJG_11715, partial [Actinomycetota bacterium]